MRTVLLTLALVLTTGAASAANYERIAEHKLINGDKLTEYRLPNGLTVLLVPRHQAKVLTYQVWFKVGSVHEKLDPKLKKTGLAHLFEHMMFRGSEKYGDGKFIELTSRLGSEKQNATTYFYRTNYYESVPSSQLDRIMELESDRMRHLKLVSEVLEKEKGAVVGELRRSLDNPGRMANDEMMKLAFQVAPYRFTVLGTEEEIKGFTLEEAQYFYKTFYAPNNATLIVIGDTDEDTLMKTAGKYYGDMAAQEIPKTVIPDEPLPTKERRFEGAHPQATSQILTVAYPIPPVTEADVIPLSLLSTHLSRGTEAALHKLLVDRGIAVGASAETSFKPNLFEISAHLVEGKKAEEALKVIDEEIARLQAKPIPKESFERALNQELLNLYGDISDNSELGNWLGEYAMLCGNYMRGFEIIDGYKKTTAEELQRVAKKYLVAAQRSIVMVRPQSKAKAKGSKAAPVKKEKAS